MSETERSHTLVVLLKRAPAVSTAGVEPIIFVIQRHCHFLHPYPFAKIVQQSFLLARFQVELRRKAAAIGIGGDAVKTAPINGDFVFCVAS